MKHECGLISDLLPMYSEGLAGEESRKAVEEHVMACANCKKELDTLRQTQTGMSAAALPMRNISRSIRKRRRMSVLLASCILLALATAFGAFVTDKQYLSYDKDQLSFSQKDGYLVISIKRPDVYLEISGMPSPDQPGIARYEVSLYTRRFDTKDKTDAPMWMQMPDPDKGLADGPVPNQAILEVPNGEEAAVYYVKGDEPSVLLYGKDLFPHGGYMILPRLALVYYTMLAASAAIVLGLLLLLFRRHERVNFVLKVLLGLPLSYLGGQLMVKGFSTLSYSSLLRDFLWILVCAAFLFIAWMIGMYSRQSYARSHS